MPDQNGPYEFSLVSRVLQETEEQIERLCNVLGIVPDRKDGEYMLGRDALEKLYSLLYATWIPPEAKA